MRETLYHPYLSASNRGVIEIRTDMMGLDSLEPLTILLQNSGMGRQLHGSAGLQW